MSETATNQSEAKGCCGEVKRSGSGSGSGPGPGSGPGAGLGWRMALEALGESGTGIVQLWSSVGLNGKGGDEKGGEGAGEEIKEEVWPELGYELRLGTRWRIYGRCGAAVRLLRQELRGMATE